MQETALAFANGDFANLEANTMLVGISYQFCAGAAPKAALEAHLGFLELALKNGEAYDILVQRFESTIEFSRSLPRPENQPLSAQINEGLSR